MSDSELIKSSSELEIRQEQRFEQLNLKELGLQPQDFAEVMDAHKELADISTTVVAEYGKNIANKTSTYTDELLGLVQNKDLDTTGQKLNEVVQVAQQLNTSSIFSVHDKFHRTLILSGFCFLKIARISLNSAFFPKPIKR